MLPGSDRKKSSEGRPWQRPKSRAIHSCNFRYAGRLSNENARAMTALHEKFALNVTTSLELYLGTSLHLNLVSLEQMALVDYISGMASSNYLLPCALTVMESSCLLEMDTALVFPIIDLLLGGTGAASEGSRELTEIDEEIMQSVTALGDQADRVILANPQSVAETGKMHQTGVHSTGLHGERETGTAHVRNDDWRDDGIIQSCSADIVRGFSVEASKGCAVKEEFEPSIDPEP